MVDHRLVEYIKNQFSRGVSEEEIKRTLATAGWSERDIENAIILSQTPPQPQERGMPAVAENEPGRIKKSVKEKAVPGRIGFILGLLAGVILISVLSLNFVIYFFAPEPNPVFIYILGGTSASDYMQKVVFLKSPSGLFSSILLLFFVMMLIYAVLKMRDPEKHKKMGKFVVIYSLVILIATLGSYTGIIASILGIAGGLLGWKGK